MKHGCWVVDPTTGEKRGFVAQVDANGKRTAKLDEIPCPTGCEWKVGKDKKRVAVKKAGVPKKAAKSTAVKE